MSDRLSWRCMRADVRSELALDLPGLAGARALLDRGPEDARRPAVLLAHGAELDLDSEFMEAIARGWCARGASVLRFRYPYMERRAREGRRAPPDRAPVLEQAHLAALAALRALLPGRRVLLAGKSMGGRIATHLAAKGAD